MIAYRLIKDRIARSGMLAVTLSVGVILFLVVAGLLVKSWPILSLRPLSSLLFSSAWRPSQGEFGFLPFLLGTVWVTAVAIVIAVPLCLLSAVYFSEYAPRLIRELSRPLVDVLAGIPSVVYGLWGVLVIVPLINGRIAPFFGSYSTGYCVLAGGAVLAIMIFPVIIHVSVEVFRSVPGEVREASLALGATRFQTVKFVVLRRALPGIIAAVVLGISRAFGETMAVLMVAGNVPIVPRGVFDPAYPLPALIANNYGEMLSIPLYDSALLFSALVLFAVVIFFIVVSRLILKRIQARIE
jgi:phosphate transport system permease protein